MKKHNLVILLLWAVFASSTMGQNTPRVIPFFSVLQPVSLYAQYPASATDVFLPGRFGASVENGIVRGLVAAASPDSFLCNPGATDFTGKFALIRRGICEFGRKALNAQKQGAIGVIVANNSSTGDSPISMSAGAVGDSVTIPVIMVRTLLSNALFNAIDQGQIVEVALSSSPLGFRLIEGQLSRDDDNNCAGDAGEPGLYSWFVKAQGASGKNTVTSTNPDGHYNLWVDTLDVPYQVSVLEPNQAWTTCPASTPVNLETDSTQVHFSAQPLTDCVELSAEISAPFLRRCFPNLFSVTVCNNGTVDAVDAYADVTMAPEFDPIYDASLPFSTVSPDVYRFELGTIAAGECVGFHFTSVPNCDSTSINQTLCYSVHAYPDSSCTPIQSLWSGADISVVGVCEGDSVRFTIANTGTGAMDVPQEYVIIEDDVMRASGQFQLGPNQTQVFKVPADGSTWRLEAGQEPEHPIPGIPAATVEACTNGSSFTTGFYQMFPLYDPGPAVDEECQEVIGSYDPNDKQGFPLGFGPQHLIRPNTDLEYLIRFQNTGTDTAFTVVVRDTLPAALNAASVRPGPSSHAYTFESVNNVLTFKFNNILLVDSFTNEPASNGFVSFKIKQQADNPYGTLIENRAAIFFDFNPPVITNRTRHEVGYVLGVVSLSHEPGAEAGDVPVVIYPNPAAPATLLRLRGEGIENAAWRLFNTAGRQVGAGRLEGDRLRLPQNNTSEEVLWLEVQSKSGKGYFVKIVVLNPQK